MTIQGKIAAETEMLFNYGQGWLLDRDRQINVGLLALNMKKPYYNFLFDVILFAASSLDSFCVLILLLKTWNNTHHLLEYSDCTLSGESIIIIVPTGTIPDVLIIVPTGKIPDVLIIVPTGAIPGRFISSLWASWASSFWSFKNIQLYIIYVVP